MILNQYGKGKDVKSSKITTWNCFRTLSYTLCHVFLHCTAPQHVLHTRTPLSDAKAAQGKKIHQYWPSGASSSTFLLYFHSPYYGVNFSLICGINYRTVKKNACNYYFNIYKNLLINISNWNMTHFWCPPFAAEKQK